MSAGHTRQPDDIAGGTVLVAPGAARWVAGSVRGVDGGSRP